KRAGERVAEISKGLDLEIGEWTLLGARFPLERAQDADVGTNALLTYQLTSNPSFSLALKESPDESKQPELVLEGALDREKQSSFELVLTAVDGGDPARSGTVQIRVNVTDLNDNPPLFSRSVYEARVAENLPAGSLVLRVRATDVDAGTNGQVSYSFSNVHGTITALFTIDSESGEVRTAGPIDFEEKSKYIFGLEARDGGGLVSHCKVQIDIMDENDNPPEITILSLSSPVPEDSPAGTVVALLNVNDPDSGENGQVWCELSGEAPLSIVASSGGSYKVVTTGALDREQASEHGVTVVARDRGRPALWSSRELVLEVSDVNDNAPVFEEAAYSAYVAENNAAGALVLRVQARDADAGANGRVSYWLAGGSAGAAGAAPLVSVEARSGALYAQRSLDYEQCREFTVAVRAQDGGSPARSSTATVRVFVLDRNDNAPRVLWPAAAAAAGEAAGGAATPFEVVPRSAEAGYLVAKVVAVDADAGRNAWLSYELVQASEPALFRVGLHSGEVRTARAVSERDAAKQRVVAVVKDHGQPALSATATLHVVLAESLQEALPELSERPAGAEEEAAAAAELQFYLVLALALLSALLVLSVALAVLARLRRAGPPAVLRCLGAQRFSLAGAAFPADFCEGTLPYSYNLCVAAPARAVPEAAWPPPPPVPVLSAEELLGGDSCEKPSSNSSAIEGEVSAQADLPQVCKTVLNPGIDREQLCRLVEKCVLRCELIVEGQMQVYRIEVEITDINDNAPSFREAEAELRISEIIASGARFPLPRAHDPDTGRTSLQSYELSSDEHFSLAVQAGPGGDQRPELVLAKALDREEAAFHELVLRAMDGGDPARTGTARIRVTVLDANDNAPVFSQAEYTVRVPEDVPVGSVLVTVTATDGDEGLNGQVKYSFHKISDRASELFQLDSESGQILLKNAFDFEKISFHELEVQAHDGGELSDTAKITITVTDVNDNAPEISVQSALSEISEDSPRGTVVALLRVQDLDSGANGQVRCSLDGDVPFRLESSRGSYYSVVTASELDREQVWEYNVTVRAADGGSPSLQSSAVLALRVLDVNDNAPVFLEERYSARLAENNAAGALVLTVRATDADWGQNARVRYRLAEGRVRGAPLSSYVSVQAETGALYALRSLDYEQVRELQLWVRAEDGGAPALSSNVSVRLLIVDENDNAPQVLYPPAGAAAGSGAAWSGVELAPRRSEAGALVAKVVAVDADAGQNAWLSYELAKATEPGLFRVGLHSGEVRTARSPLARDAARHSLVVLVRDHGRPALSATATLSVVLAESVAELLAELGSAADEAAAPGEPAASLTRWLVLAVAAVSCLFVAFLLLLLALRLRRWHRQQLLPADSGALRGVPVSHFVGIDGVRAFLQSYSHDVSLTADSRKSQLRFSAASCCDPLPARPPPDEPAPLLGDQDPAGALPAPSAPPSVSFSLHIFSATLSSDAPLPFPRRVPCLA
ncbi:uncharacterized protein LOC120507565, partial [Passer montanus]|uniref:uncharacterized protein LOC120507565 n=1 Tax=Passer montanus TaxID=9160 RepID=UPI0019611E5D